jgi:hypothetical protein
MSDLNPGAPISADDEPTASSNDVPADDVSIDVAPAGDVPSGTPPRWWQARWWQDLTPERTIFLIQWATTVVLVGGCTLVVFRTMHPSLLFTNSTPTGGDMGAHVLGPAFLRDHLLPTFRLSGWSMDWYAGLPIYRFYMVVPALLILFFDVVLPYGVAFKLVAVIGLVTFPFACWTFGHLARFAFPLPPLFAVAGTVFLYDESFTIYGGNIASTMAGEFSFSIALSLTMVAFGFFARGLQDGTYRITAAVFIALAALSHGIVLMFVFGGVALMGLVWLDRTRWRYTWTTIGAAILLSAFWVFPFLFGHSFMTDMKYGGEPGGGSFTSFWGMFFPLPAFFNVLFTTLALIGFAASVARRHLMGAWLGVLGLILVAAVYVARDSLPVIGLLWNPRILPFLHLVRYLLAAIGVVAIVRGITRLVELERFAGRARRAMLAGDQPPPPPPSRSDPIQPVRWWVAGAVTAAVASMVVVGVLGFRFQQLPFGKVTARDGGGIEYSWGPIHAESRRGFVDGWARWNFSGYEAKPAYGEYYDLVQAMKRLGEDPDHGCGRALWENSGENNRYGTTMALMLLPFWTDSCIASMEGLFFEAAGTTPYHFITAAAMSKQSSNPVRELRYDNNDAERGVRYLQALGVRYFLAYTNEAVDEAMAQPELTLLERAGPWHIFEVADTELVVTLENQPVVVEGRSGDQRERWLELGTSWFQQQDEWVALPAADGPDDWQRVEVVVDEARRQGAPGQAGRRVDIVVPQPDIVPVPLPEVTVSDVELGTDTVRFRVDQVGVPVLVRVSYFPNWGVKGAEGPYRVAPNMMLVIPTENDVRLHYDYGRIDLVAYLMTLVGFGALVQFRRRGDVVHLGPTPSGFSKPPPPPATDEPGQLESLVGPGPTSEG